MAEHMDPNAARKLPIPSQGYGREELENNQRAFVERFRRRYNECRRYWDPMYDKWADDWRFYQGDSIGDMNRRNRQKWGRPTMEPNYLQKFVRSLRSDELFNNLKVRAEPVDIPGEQTRPSEGPGPEEMFVNATRDKQFTPAQAYTGVLNNILSDSITGQHGRDIAMHGLVGGWGVWRIYVDDEGTENLIGPKDKHSWNRKLCVRRVKDPCSVYLDPDADDPLYEDGAFAIVLTTISRHDAIQEFGEVARKLQSSEWANSQENMKNRWYDHVMDRYTVAEYFERSREIVRVFLLLSPDGQEFEQTPQEFAPVRDEFLMSGGQVVGEARKVRTVVRRWVINGDQILKGPDILPFSRIPLVPFLGDHGIMDGRKTYFGMVRPMKGSQKAFSLAMSTMSEIMAQATESPIVYPKKAIQRHQKAWQNYRISGGFGLPYDHENMDGSPIPPPVRLAAPEMPQSMPYYMNFLQDSFHQISGLPPGSLGQGKGGKTPESARSILAKQEASDLVTSLFQENYRAAVESICNLLIPAFSKVYNRKRHLRIIDEDGKSDWIQINDDRVIPDMQSHRVVTLNSLRNDPHLDVRVTVDEQPISRRVEMATSMMDLVKGSEELAPLLVDNAVQLADMVGGSAIARKLWLMVTPERYLSTEQKSEKLEAIRGELEYKKAEGQLRNEYEGPPQPSPEDEKDLAQAGKLKAETEKLYAEIAQLQAQLRMESGNDPASQIQSAQGLEQLSQAQRQGEFQDAMNQMKLKEQQSKSQTADIKTGEALVKAMNQTLLTNPANNSNKGSKSPSSGKKE